MELRVTVVQCRLEWENPAANRERISRMMEMAGVTDVILLPEMFTTGFTMASERLAESMDGPTVTWMQGKATELGAALAGTVIIRENGSCFNRLVWVSPGRDPCITIKNTCLPWGESSISARVSGASPWNSKDGRLDP